MSTLRERIAALQQRSSSPTTSQSSSTKKLGLGEVMGLKEKIATFEKRGGVPVPRASFGLAPPSQGKASSHEMYGNRFVSTPIPADNTTSRSNSVRSVSPAPGPKRERRVSSYGDNSWGGPIRHQRSFSTAGDNLIPMHTGTTSSDEVSSITSSFPATPREGSTSFLKFGEVREDPEDNNGCASPVPTDKDALSSSKLPSPDDISGKSFNQLSPCSPSTCLSPGDPDGCEDVEAKQDDKSTPDIIVHELYNDANGSTKSDSDRDNLTLDGPATASQSVPPVSDQNHSSGDLNDDFSGALPPEICFKDSVASKDSDNAPIVEDASPLNKISTPALGPVLKAKKSQPSIIKLTPLAPLAPLKPPQQRPISVSLSTPEIMDQFPAVPSNLPAVPSEHLTIQGASTSSESNINSRNKSAHVIPSKLAPSPPTTESLNKKPNPKSSIPGWWDYNSDDEQEGGWATVIVSARR